MSQSQTKLEGKRKGIKSSSVALLWLEHVIFGISLKSKNW